MTQDVLQTATVGLLGGEVVASFPLDRLLHLITLTQHATDILLNEIERRGELTFLDNDVQSCRICPTMRLRLS
jgi:hypothetical protein